MLLKNYASITRSGSQPDLVIPSPIENGDCTYGVQLLGTLKYDRIDIQSNVFDGANSIPLLYRLLKNYASITRSGSQPDLVLPSPNVKGDCTYGDKLLGTLKYDRIEIQSKVFRVLIAFLYYTCSYKIMPALPGLVISQTWYYQAQM
jgi:hypothetical protein